MSPGNIAQELNHITNSEIHTTTDPLWTVEEVAGYLKLQPETIRGMARRGKLPAIKIGKVWRFRKSAIKEMIQEQS